MTAPADIWVFVSVEEIPHILEVLTRTQDKDRTVSRLASLADESAKTKTAVCWRIDDATRCAITSHRGSMVFDRWTGPLGWLNNRIDRIDELRRKTRKDDEQ